MLGKEWFKPEVPLKDLLLGLYEWICEADSVIEMGERIQILQEEADRDPLGDFARAMGHALREHASVGHIRFKKPSPSKTGYVEHMRTYGKEMTEDYFAQEATSD